MKRGIVAVAAIAAFGGFTAGLAALERATLILTNGERVSGEVVFHTEARTNIRADKQEFNLKLTDGREVPIPVSQVVVVDFVGGTPTNVELAKLGGGHTLVKRNGDAQNGRLVDLIGGDTVRWQPDGGSSQDLPISEVARVYLNADAARRQFNYTATTSSTGGTTPGAIQVPANVRWTDGGTTVRRGDRLTFQVTGTINYSTSPNDTAGPNGSGVLVRPSYPVPNRPVGGLIGRIGNGTPFWIGDGIQPIAANATGRLMFSVNDNELTDNTGSFSVTIVR